MKFNKRRAILVLLVPIVGLVAFLGIRSFVFSKIETRIGEKIQALNASGFNVRYSALSFNWGTNVIEIRGLLLEKNAYDTTCLYPEFISLAKIRGEGFRLFPLLFNNVLSFESVEIDNPHIRMRANSQLKPDSSSKREKDFTLKVDHTRLTAAEFSYTDSTTCNVTAGIKSNVAIDGLTLDFLVDNPFTYQANWLSMDDTEVQLPEELYTFKIKRARMDFLKSVFRIDSAEIIPTASKIEFGRKRGYQLDRFEGIIPFLECDQLSFSLGDSSRVMAGLAEVQFYLKIFRDKHQPFRPVKKLLPMDQLAGLPFALSIDSMKIRKSYVEYEEYAEGATAPGAVAFDNLYASLYNINNRSRTGTTELSARADLQSTGRINLLVTFPLEENKSAKLTGDLANFDMPQINSILQPSANIKVESGKMEKLSFNFAFNPVRSTGALELQYKDLKLAIFKEEEKQKGDKAEKDNFKSFMMNTFIFRTDMDKDLPEEKRTGTIAFMRDDNRSIFNFWVKSLVSGIKSAYNLDKVEAKKTEKEIRREQRLTLREARKKRRAERKRDRG